MSATAVFLTQLCAEEVDEMAGTWQLTEPLQYRSEILGGDVIVPVGFVTDFASVPRVLGMYDLEGGKCNKAAVVHDWLYSVGSSAGGVTRDVADQVLREAIIASGYSSFTASVFYAAVRVGGASHWKQPNKAQPQDVSVAMKTFAAMRQAIA